MVSKSSSRGAPHLPTEQQVIDLLAAEFGRAGYEIEAVEVNTRTRPARVTVVADGDAPLDLAAVTALSRTASELLDGAETGDDEYVLEVTSRGVDRPLTSEKHFRRAQGRVAQFTMADGSALTGRIGALADGNLAVVTSGRSRADLRVTSIKMGDVSKAIVQVEFTAPSQRELELAGVSGEESDTA